MPEGFWDKWCAHWGVTRPERGHVYTIRDVRLSRAGTVHLRVVEIVNPPVEFIDGPTQEPWWWGTAFRPTDEARLDQFRQHLAPQPRECVTASNLIRATSQARQHRGENVGQGSAFGGPRFGAPILRSSLALGPRQGWQGDGARRITPRRPSISFGAAHLSGADDDAAFPTAGVIRRSRCILLQRGAGLNSKLHQEKPHSLSDAHQSVFSVVFHGAECAG
ncbi:hypothetical protein [Consotaella aegiceratis]|uniref:hypothetical protein n=1 Tax=Consotaella aegiceratis TaxID=3097961 RepID=UPI002F3F9BC7